MATAHIGIGSEERKTSDAILKINKHIALLVSINSDPFTRRIAIVNYIFSLSFKDVLLINTDNFYDFKDLIEYSKNECPIKELVQASIKYICFNTLPKNKNPILQKRSQKEITELCSSTPQDFLKHKLIKEFRAKVSHIVNLFFHIHNVTPINVDPFEIYGVEQIQYDLDALYLHTLSNVNQKA